MAGSVVGTFIGNAIFKTVKGAGSVLLHSPAVFETLPLPYERGWTRRGIAAPFKAGSRAIGSALAKAEERKMMMQAETNIRIGFGGYLAGVDMGARTTRNEINRQVNEAIGFLSGQRSSASILGNTLTTEPQRRNLAKEIRGIVIDQYSKTAPYTYTKNEMRTMNRLMQRDNVSPHLRQKFTSTLLGDETPYQSFIPGGYNQPMPAKEMYETLYADYGHDAIEEEMLRIGRFKNRPSKVITKGLAYGAVSGTIGGGMALGAYGAFGGAYRADVQRRNMFGPDPYVQYPGTTSPPPDLGADGDLVFALHNGRKR